MALKYEMETSLYHPSSVSMMLKWRMLIFKRKTRPLWRDPMIFLTSDSGKRIRLHPTQTNAYPMEGLANGHYMLDIFRATSQTGYYRSYLHIPIVSSAFGVEFEVSPFVFNNSMRLSRFYATSAFLNECLQPTKYCQSQAEEIVARAQAETRPHFMTYNKVLAIHDFVASYLAYDRDVVKQGRLQGDFSALTVMHERKCVCQGYVNLTVAMLRAVGIPAFGLCCHAIDPGNRWTPDRQEEARKANHIMVAAYVQGRWLLMDPTWDSDNVYENRQFCHSMDLGLKRLYFDMSVPFLSLTHKLTV